MSLQKTTFTWNSDAKNKENELQSSAMEKENEEQPINNTKNDNESNKKKSK